MKTSATTILLLTPLITGCLNPFKRYAHQFHNVKWVSNEESSIDLTIYVLGKNQTIEHLCILKHESTIDYCMCGFEDSLEVNKINENGIDIIDSFVTKRTYLTDDKYKSTVIETDSDFFTSNGIEIGDNVSLQMEPFDPEKEATALMFSNAKYIGDKYSFETSNNLNNIRTKPPFRSYFVSYGSMIINEEETKVGLKFISDNEYFVFKNDNLDDIVFSGTYSNEWTDITLNLEVNNIDDSKELKIKAEFLLL